MNTTVASLNQLLKQILLKRVDPNGLENITKVVAIYFDWRDYFFLTVLIASRTVGGLRRSARTAFGFGIVFQPIALLS